MTGFWDRLRTRPWFRRSVRTFLQAFLALLIPGALGWLNDLTAWSRSQGQSPFPDAHSLAYVAVSAITAGVIAVITGLWTATEDVIGHGLLRTIPPDTPPGQVGAVRVHPVLTVGLIVLAVVVVVLLW